MSRGRAPSAATGFRCLSLPKQKIDQAFIGSCANGQLEDLEIAARVLRGKTVAPGVRLLVTPASQAVYREAMRLGYLQDIADAGGVVTNSTCGACFGYHMGVVGPGEVCLTVEHPQLHRPDGQHRSRDLHGLPGHRRRLGDHRIHHRRKERDHMRLAISGKVWVFGDNLNTDAMYPAFAMKMDPPEAARHIFYEVRPGWTDQVQPGDIVVAGKNFGIGSSRPVAALFTELGVAGLVAEEFNSLFFRNAVNAGLPAMTVPDATAVFSDGDTGTFDLAEGSWRNDTTGACGIGPQAARPDPRHHRQRRCDAAAGRAGLHPRRTRRPAAVQRSRDARRGKWRMMALLGRLLCRVRSGETAAGCPAALCRAGLHRGHQPGVHRRWRDAGASAGKGVGDNVSPHCVGTGYRPPPNSWC